MPLSFCPTTQSTQEILKFKPLPSSGLTGILLVLALLTMYICSTEYARRHLHRWFWNTHQLYPVVMGLIVLHGAGRLLQVSGKDSWAHGHVLPQEQDTLSTKQ